MFFIYIVYRGVWLDLYVREIFYVLRVFCFFLFRDFVDGKLILWFRGMVYLEGMCLYIYKVGFCLESGI